MFAGYLDGFEYEAFDQVINIEFEGRAAMENASSYGNTPEEPTPRPDWEMLPRPCTPLSQSDSCELRLLLFINVFLLTLKKVTFLQVLAQPLSQRPKNYSALPGPGQLRLLRPEETQI